MESNNFAQAGRCRDSNDHIRRRRGRWLHHEGEHLTLLQPPAPEPRLRARGTGWPRSWQTRTPSITGTARRRLSNRLRSLCMAPGWGLAGWALCLLSPLAYALSLIAYPLSPLAYPLSPLAYSLSPLAYSLSPLAYSLSPLAYPLSPLAYSLSPLVDHLFPLAYPLSLLCL